MRFSPIGDLLVYDLLNLKPIPVFWFRGSRGHDHMAVEFTTTYAISAFHH